ncbi:MAG: putative MFS-type transporter [Chroococcidiopsis cubana SAG 39.79]|uniref:MFS transporter n=1 Tax=Chroococcidiopsis cubana SAG 39.79 TaxID=388085 RepID=A0AB37UPR2_9CYAN|nr:MFS transporter [Chroococcidiopsis cubana]MDZ4876225.1 putative MFS-type transporter [Chroococcidiopsis cubana SAG 39.79]PSB65449.1 MFS transporter [Chroococcidiopsis cubana CCALA 043]RUT13434.1 MFS transporter [Chroococcidiopsis cubana SAG 39.79]
MSKNSLRSPKKSLKSLDWLNFFLADVRDGVGPYLAIYLQASHKWSPANIGIAMSAMGIATVIAQTPAGAVVDRLRQKRLLVVVAAALVAVGCIGMILSPTLPTVVSAQALIGVAAAIFPPAIAAITLGIVGYNKLDRRIGRNEAFNHAGNVAAAALAGTIGHFVAREGIFVLVAVTAIASAISVLQIRNRDIDPDLARAAKDGQDGEGQEKRSHISGIGQILSDRRILIFAVSAVLFHFANAAMLPLVGQRLAHGKATGASLYMSACIIVAQLVMIPVSTWAGSLAHAGRKPVFLLGFAILPIRGVLYTFSDNPFFLVSVQILDGIGAGIFGVVSVLIVADLTKGTGRFNLTQGAISTAVGIGASLSNLLTGFVVQEAGYNAGFLTLAAIASVALACFWLLMPETNSLQQERMGRSLVG